MTERSDFNKYSIINSQLSVPGGSVLRTIYLLMEYEVKN